MSFSFPCSIRSFFFFHHLHIVAHFCLVWLVFKSSSWVCKWMAVLCDQLCRERTLHLQTVFMGMKWDSFLPLLLDSGIESVQPLAVHLLSPSHLYPLPLHANTLYLRKPCFPGFTIPCLSLPSIDLLFTEEL